MRLVIKIIFFSLLSLPSIAQDGWGTISWDEFEESLLEVGAQYSESTYSVDIRYSTFKGLSSTSPYESSVGYYQKNKTLKQTSILGVTTIEDSEHKITLDSLNAIVALNNSVVSRDVIDVDEYKRTKSLIEVIKKQELKTSVTYLIKYTSRSPISKTKLVVSKSGALKSLIVYYAKAKEYLDDNDELQEDYLWLKMDYFNYSKALKHKELKKSDLLLKVKNDYQLRRAYSRFQLVDLRYKK